MIAATVVILGSLVGALVLVRGPIGETKVRSGLVTAVGFLETEGGSRASVVVRIDGRTVRLTMPSNLDCRVGDVIQFNARRGRTAYAYSARGIATPCSRALP
jgi:co-chaperonin GroES (HSP10)